jgi:Predicted transcriptional regulators
MTNRYKDARIARPMTQEELAIAAGISIRTVRRLEAGKSVGAESKRAVASVLGISATEPAGARSAVDGVFRVDPPFGTRDTIIAGICYIGWLISTGMWLHQLVVAPTPFTAFMNLLHIVTSGVLVLGVVTGREKCLSDRGLARGIGLVAKLMLPIWLIRWIFFGTDNIELMALSAGFLDIGLGYHLVELVQRADEADNAAQESAQPTAA